MKIELDNLARPIDISIPMRFNGPQPNAYGIEPATSTACVGGDLVGDTRRGGSVNFERYSFIPHCNGTHTECVGHITHERISVRECLRDVFVTAVLVSVEPESLGDDKVLSKHSLSNAFEALTYVRATYTQGAKPKALVVRTLPNDDTKLTRQYGEDNIPPFFTAEAMEFIVECGFKHLLVDMPSIDRIFDDGKLTNHRIFWNVEAGSFETHTATRIYSTITELIYVPNEVADGEYLLNLQIAPFVSDAAPSRPVLFTT
ncbi:MAG: cyclase family protein [Pyrinomonadaceae bacterium]